MQPVDFTDDDAAKFRAAMRDPELRRQLYEETRLKSEANARAQMVPRKQHKRKMASEPLLDEEEMEILKRSKVFEEDEPKPELENIKEKEEFDLDEFFKDFDYGGKPRKHKTRRGHRKYKKHTKRHHKKSKTHKRSKMYRRRKTLTKH